METDYSHRTLEERVETLCEIFPEINKKTTICSSDVRGSEGWFAVPRWSILASSYAGAVSRVLVELEKRLGFESEVGEIAPDNLIQRENTIAYFRSLSARQAGNAILVFPGGLQGRSEMIQGMPHYVINRDLGAFATGIMLLTDPERCAVEIDLLCLGDVSCRYKRDDRWYVVDDSFPVFCFHNYGGPRSKRTFYFRLYHQQINGTREWGHRAFYLPDESW